MKKRALFLLAVVMMVMASSAAKVRAITPDGPPPTCNPITDPRCK